MSSIPGQGVKIPYASWPKKQNIKHKQYCNKFNKDFKKERKTLPAMQETRVPSLDQEDPLEKEMATSSSILAWKIPWPEEPGGL